MTNDSYNDKPVGAKPQNADADATPNADAATQPGDARQRILQAASDLMIDKGIRETSLKDIAKKAGMSPGTLYYYYSAKDDIIYDIADNNLRQITDGLLNWIDNIETGTPREQILKTVFEKILAAETRGKLHLYLVSEAGTANSMLKQKYAQRYEDWRKTLVFGLSKVLKNDDAENIPRSYLILAALDGLIIQNMFSSGSAPIDDIVKLIVSAYQ